MDGWTIPTRRVTPARPLLEERGLIPALRETVDKYGKDNGVKSEFVGRAELANGTFMVHSTPGKGTTVLATLPFDAVPAPRGFSVSEAS